MLRLPLMPTLVAAVALVALAASPAHAVATLHGVPERARPGDTLELRWDGLGVAAEEAELELSLDGGRWIRISPELDAREGHFAWTVPAWANGVARLRLRMGGEGFEEFEVCVRELVIGAARAAVPPEPAGEWWKLERPSVAAASEQLAAASIAPIEAPVAIRTDDAGAGALAVSETRSLFAGTPTARPWPRPASRVRTPPRVPLRN